MLGAFYFLVLLLSTTFGQPCEFTSSAENEIDFLGNCTETSGKRNLFGQPCQGHGYIPERPKKEIVHRTSKKGKPQYRTTLPVVKLGDGATYYYFETSLKLNYIEAFQFCRKNHMHLLSTETKKEDDLIKNYLFNKFPKVHSVWTSGTDLGKEGHYVWLSTGQPFTFTNWHPVNVVEPNNFNNSEHCIHMYQYFNTPDNFYWNDHRCSYSYNFICETEAIPLCN